MSNITYWVCFQVDGTISHHDMFDYVTLTQKGYTKAFEAVNELLTTLLQEMEGEGDECRNELRPKRGPASSLRHHAARAAHPQRAGPHTARCLQSTSGATRGAAHGQPFMRLDILPLADTVTAPRDRPPPMVVRARDARRRKSPINATRNA